MSISCWLSLYTLKLHFNNMFHSIMEGEESLQKFSPLVMVKDPAARSAVSLLPRIFLFHGTSDYSIPSAERWVQLEWLITWCMFSCRIDLKSLDWTNQLYTYSVVFSSRRWMSQVKWNETFLSNKVKWNSFKPFWHYFIISMPYDKVSTCCYWPNKMRWLNQTEGLGYSKDFWIVYTS